jgi:uncharacterized membrane protein
MVKIENNSEEGLYRILLRPNQSTDWKSSLIFISIIAFTCLTIGIGFALAGATMILPFAGLEILFVATCVYLVMKQTYKQEVITLTKEKLTIAKGAGKIDQEWEYFRMWSFISVEKPEHPWYPAHIIVSSKGERVPIGDFLNEDEKEELVKNLERIIQELK